MPDNGPSETVETSAAGTTGHTPDIVERLLSMTELTGTISDRDTLLGAVDEIERLRDELAGTVRISCAEHLHIAVREVAS